MMPHWWGRHILIGAFSVLFLLLGIDTLAAAYQLKNPLEFIMYFFGSNLIILVSATGILHCAIRVFNGIRKPVAQQDVNRPEQSPGKP